jgi:hypothetical protein
LLILVGESKINFLKNVTFECDERNYFQMNVGPICARMNILAMTFVVITAKNEIVHTTARAMGMYRLNHGSDSSQADSSHE